MLKPKILDTRAVGELNRLMADRDRYFIIFWEYYPFKFSETTYCSAFLEGVLALYRLYVDCGGARLKYFFDQHRHGRNATLEKMQKHYRNVCNLRTFFSHNLYLSNSLDKITYDKAPKWFVNTCGEVFPTREEYSKMEAHI